MGYSKRRSSARMNARKAAEARWGKKYAVASLNLESPAELDFGNSSIPPLPLVVIESPILQDQVVQQTSASASASANTNSKTIDNNKPSSFAFASCLICHDRYVHDSTPTAASAFVSKLPTSVAQAFTKALGELILRSNLPSSEREELLSQLEKSLYCSNCMKELHELAVITEQFDKLNYWLDVKRMEIITRLQTSHSNNNNRLNIQQPPVKCSAAVVEVRAALITNLQAPCRNNNKLLLRRFKPPTIPDLSPPPPPSKALKRNYPMPKSTVVAAPRKITPETTWGRRVGVKRRRIMNEKEKKQEEIWEHLELGEVKVEIDEEEEEEDVEIMDQYNDDGVDPLGCSNDHEPYQESMFMDHDDDNNFDLEPQRRSIDLVTKTTTLGSASPPPPQIIRVTVVRCSKCMELFMNQAELDVHEETEHRPPPLPCKCNLCGLICNYKTILWHLKSVHYKKKKNPKHKKQDPTNNDDAEDEEDVASGNDEEEVSQSQCTECNAITKDLPYHRLFKHQARFSCDTCQQQSPDSDSASIFKHYRDYRLHLTTTHPELGLGSHQCQDCGKHFVNEGGLSSHKLKIHNPDFPHVCTQCQQRFSQESELQNHIKGFHDKICHICDAKFTTRDILTTHLLRHAGKVNRKHQCDRCSKSFTQPGKLKNHVAAIHGVNKEAHVCEVCGKGFPIYNYLYIHLRSHESPEEKEARRLKAKAAAEARKLSGKPVLVSKGRPRIRPIKEKKSKKAKDLSNNINVVVEAI